MSGLIEINWKPSRSELRMFGWLLTAGCILVAVVVYVRTGSVNVPVGLVSASIALAAIGTFFPAALRSFYLVWVVAAYPVGWFVSHLLLGLVFFLLITPIGIVMRCLGHDPLKRKFDKHAPSYWKDRRQETKVERYFRQY